MPDNFITRNIPSLSWKWVALCIAFLLSVETLPLHLGAQTIPPVSLISIILVPYTLRHFKKSPLATMLSLFICYAVIHSLIALYIDNISMNWQGHIRESAWTRQVVSLLLGSSVFFITRHAARHTTPNNLVKTILWGSLATMFIALVTTFAIITRVEFLGVIVGSIRKILVPMGWDGTVRVTGISSEPAHYAFFLSVIAFPALIWYWQSTSKKRIAPLSFLGVILLTLGFTFSGSGIFVFACTLIIAWFIKCGRRCVVWTISASILGIILLFTIYPDNYLAHHTSAIAEGTPTLSLTTRLYSTLGPLAHLYNSRVWFGYGLGSSSIHLDDMVSKDVADQLKFSSWEGNPNLKSFVGKIVAETGIFGLLLMAFSWFLAISQLVQVYKYSKHPEERFFAKIVALGILSCIAGHSIGYGTYTFPYLWFWLGLSDSLWIKLKESA